MTRQESSCGGGSSANPICLPELLPLVSNIKFVITAKKSEEKKNHAIIFSNKQNILVNI